MAYSYELSNFLYAKLREDSSAAHVFRWTNPQQFYDELKSEEGVRINGFTSRSLTLEEMKKDSGHLAAGEKVYRLERTNEKDKYYLFIKTTDKLPSHKMSFDPSQYVDISIHFAQTVCGESVRRENVPHKIEQFLESFDKTLAEYDELILKLIKKAEQKEKRAKIHEMTAKSLELWLTNICETLAFPYHIEEGAHRIILSILYDKKTQVDFHIPIANFQKTLPHLLDTITRCTQVLEELPFRVLISNPSTKYRWKTNENTR
ncbi:hypothetical protein FACS1894200_09250 [Spirochaetia bacterium]|nr:hypothetical protein FACS1894200_09250 [Spirochaetia bacterium]